MSARSDRVKAQLGKLRPDLAVKVQTAERGQLVLFPQVQAASIGHQWRFQGTDLRFRERHFLCSVCGALRIVAGELELFGVSRTPKEPPCTP